MQRPHAFLAPVVFLSVSAGFAPAAVINVPEDQPTIQAGINAASSGDMVLVAPGTYNEAINFLGKAITVASSGGAAATTIDGTGLNSSVVKFIANEGQNSILDGFTVSGSILALADGAGILASPASPTIRHCRIFNNRTVVDGRGGGIYHSGGPMLMMDCTIESNAATGSCLGQGGGLWSNSNPTLINVKFLDNRAFSNMCPGCGSCASARGGGAYFAPGSAAVLINCELRRNIAHPNGTCIAGGVYRPALMINCLVADNSVSGNTSSGYAGVFGTLAETTLISCTVTANKRANGAGLGVAVLAGIVQNSIIFGNDEAEVSGSVSYSCVEGGFAGPGNISSDPLFVDVATQDYHLQDTSPCRDVADRRLLPADTEDLDGDGNSAETLSRDLDLLRRIVNGEVDMGAYEWQNDCLPDIAPTKPGVAGNGVINIDDLLSVIIGWGPCDQCIADIDDDGDVDIDDLLAVIIGWGNCP